MPEAEALEAMVCLCVCVWVLFLADLDRRLPKYCVESLRMLWLGMKRFASQDAEGVLCFSDVMRITELNRKGRDWNWD